MILRTISVIAILCSVSCSQEENNSSLKEIQSIEAQIINSGVEVRSGGFLSKTKAFLYSSNIKPKGFLVISPGGKIEPTEMSLLCETFAKQGYVVFNIKYTQNVAAIPLPGNQDRARRFAKAIKDDIGSLSGLPGRIAELASQDLPVYGFGHSLGGAALGTFGSESGSAFEKIVLFGTSKLIGEPSVSDRRTSLIIGSNDTVVSRSEISNLESVFDTEVVEVEGVNHFCILPNTSGDEEFRARDNSTDLDQVECVNLLVQTVDGIFSVD